MLFYASAVNSHSSKAIKKLRRPSLHWKTPNNSGDFLKFLILITEYSQTGKFPAKGKILMHLVNFFYKHYRENKRILIFCVRHL